MHVSIIIPTLNEEDYIGFLLECLSDQTFKDFEVLVIDGGSTDLTKQVVLPYEDKLNLRFISAPKKGVSYQRNYGASLAKSDTIIFMDADVSFKPDFLEVITLFLKNRSEIDIFTTWMRPDSNDKFYRVLFGVYNRAVAKAQKWLPTAMGAFICIRKTAFQSLNGFDEKLVVAEDYDLILRAAKKKYKFALLRTPGIYFSLRRAQKLGKRRYLLSLGRSAVYFPLRNILKTAKWVDYNMEEGGAFYKSLKKEKPRKAGTID